MVASRPMADFVAGDTARRQRPRHVQTAGPTLESRVLKFALKRFAARSLIIACALLLAATPTTAVAGMPSPLPDDIATVLRLGDEPEQRIQVISFFLVGVLLSALAVKFLWNGLRGEFSKLPRVSYGKALLMTIGWGLLFCIVLVMISGARELMTPGAWKKSGATYEVKEVPQSSEEAVEP